MTDHICDMIYTLGAAMGLSTDECDDIIDRFRRAGVLILYLDRIGVSGRKFRDVYEAQSDRDQFTALGHALSDAVSSLVTTNDPNL